MAIPADLAPPVFSAAEVALVFGLLFTIAAIWVLDISRGPAVNLAGSVPLVGGPLRSAVDNAFGAARNLLQVWLSAELASFSALLSWLQTLWQHLSQTAAGFAELTYAAVWKVSFQVIPAQVGAAMTYAGGLVAAAEGRSLAALAVLRLETRAISAGATAAASAAYNAASAQALGLFATAETDAAALAGKAEADAAALFLQAEAAALAEAATVTAYVDTRFSQSIAIGAAAEAALGGQLSGIAAQLGADLNAGVSALEQEIARAKALLSGQTLTAVAAVAADVALIRAMRCMQVCNTLGALGEGLELLDILAVLALVEAAQADPAGAQQWIGDNIRPTVEGLVSSVRAAI